MDKNFNEKIKEKLKQDKESIEQELKKFAKKDENVKDDWDTNYPKFSAEPATGSQQLEESADEVEEYMTLLPIEHSLELRLQKINWALEKLEKGEYGKCKKCGKEIGQEKLEISPETELCSDCQK